MEGDSRALNQHEVSAEVWMEAVGAFFLPSSLFWEKTLLLKTLGVENLVHPLISF